jgi:hypothetical protein
VSVSESPNLCDKKLIREEKLVIIKAMKISVVEIQKGP